MNTIKIIAKSVIGGLLALSVFTLLGCNGVVTKSPTAAVDGLVTTQQEYFAAAAKAQPGDTIVLANGVWNDFEILLDAKGTQEQPITLTAQEKGKVIISGESNLRLAGEHLVVSGLVFKNGYSPTGEVIAFRKNKHELAYHSRVTEVVIDDFNSPERLEASFWVMMYGKYNRFDHNHVQNKRNVGVMMAVRLDTEDSRENHHHIDHNYFGPRPNLGSNGGETLRIGTSHYSLSNSFTVVENNYFDRCSGEVETISNKSGSNEIRGNVFYQGRGTLTLRHGGHNIVENNVFFGGGKDHTGGIRVINANQTIRNNYIEGLTGYRFGGGLVIMNGVPNSPINRYHQVKDSVIENNTLVNVDHIQLAAGSDKERTATPQNVTFKNNLIVHESGKDTITIFDDISGINFSDNVTNKVESFQIKNGFTQKDIKLVENANGLKFPADESIKAGVARSLKPITKSEVGVSWYPKPEPKPRFNTGKTHKVSDADAVVAAIKHAKSGDMVELAAGTYVFNKTLTVDKALTIRAAKGKEVNIFFQRATLFNMPNGGSLALEGLHISGEQAPDNGGNAIIRTARHSMLNNYELTINNCVFVDMNVNHSFDVLSVAKGTMADNIEINNSVFKNITGSVLKLAAETDNYGIYNSEYVTINNSHFENVGGAIVDYYRGGTDESTFGPHFTMKNSTVVHSGFSKKNWSKASLVLHGVQVSNLIGNTFKDSRPVVIHHTVGEPITKIIDNRFEKMGLPQVTELNSGKANTAYFSGNSTSK